MVACGGALGALSRYGLNLLVPSATIISNIAGSFLMGALYTALFGSEKSYLSPLLLVGFLGSFTTYSTFSLIVVEDFEAGMPWRALGYALATVVSCVLACYIGYRLVDRLV